MGIVRYLCVLCVVFVVSGRYWWLLCDKSGYSPMLDGAFSIGVVADTGSRYCEVHVCRKGGE